MITIPSGSIFTKLLEVFDRRSRTVSAKGSLIPCGSACGPGTSTGCVARRMGHARWLHGDPNQDGMITYKPGIVLQIQTRGQSDNFFLGTCPGSGFVQSELMPSGEISFTPLLRFPKLMVLLGAPPRARGRLTQRVARSDAE